MYPPLTGADAGIVTADGAAIEFAALAVEKSGVIAAGGANAFAFSSATGDGSIVSGFGGAIAATAGESVGIA